MELIRGGAKAYSGGSFSAKAYSGGSNEPPDFKRKNYIYKIYIFFVGLIF